MPNRYLTVWTGGAVPYWAALSIASALANDPDSCVELHLVGRPPVGPWVETLRREERFSIHHLHIDGLFHPWLRPVYDRIPTTAHSARSNLIRLALLHRRGGVYLDMDTFVLRPLPLLAPGAFAGLERVWAEDRRRVEGGLGMRRWPATALWAVTWAAKAADSRWAAGRLRLADRLAGIDAMVTTEQMNNAVIGAPAGSDLTAALLDRAVRCDPTVRYSLGPGLLHDTIADDPRLATVFPPELFYAVPPGESHRIFHDRRLALPDRAAVVHYVNSNHRSLLSTLRPDDPRFSRPELFWRLAAGAERFRCGGHDRSEEMAS